MRALAIAVSAVAAIATSADACLPIAYSDHGRYVGGDLAEQIARKAATIQIVRATERHLLSRTDRSAEAFYTRGEWPDESQYEPMWAPGRYRYVYVYVFEVVETLKGGEFQRDVVDQSLLRIMSEPMEEERSRDIRGVFQRPWIFPLSRLDFPGARLDRDVPPGATIRNRGPPTYAALPMDYRPAGQGGGCTGEFRLAIGETYVVLRDEHGRPYFADWSEPGGGLPIEAKFGDRTEGWEMTFNAPALVRIVGADDPYLIRLRAALNKAP
jgi:hypothetical protein